MTDNERFDAALIAVKGGKSITQVIESQYRNARQYRNRTTKFQQAELSRARQEYLLTRPDPRRKQAPRFFVETTEERRRDVEKHCQVMGISITRFVNSAINEALRQAKVTS